MPISIDIANKLSYICKRFSFQSKI